MILEKKKKKKARGFLGSCSDSGRSDLLITPSNLNSILQIA